MVRNAGNKAQLRPAGAGALPELGNITDNHVLVSVSVSILSHVSVGK